MRKLVMMLMLAVVFMIVQSMQAAEVGCAVKVGTLGPGIDFTLGLGEAVNLRAGINALKYDLQFDSEDDDEGDDASAPEEIDIEIDFMTVGALLDWHPGGGGFRLSAGVILNNNELNLSADISDTVEINDIEYSVDYLNGNVGFASIAPYVGIGWGNAVDQNGRWTFAFDLGVMFQGSPEITLEATASDSRLQDQLNADIQREIDDLEDDADIISMWPVISFGVGYRF